MAIGFTLGSLWLWRSFIPKTLPWGLPRAKPCSRPQRQSSCETGCLPRAHVPGETNSQQRNRQHQGKVTEGPAASASLRRRALVAVTGSRPRLGRGGRHSCASPGVPTRRAGPGARWRPRPRLCASSVRFLLVSGKRHHWPFSSLLSHCAAPGPSCSSDILRAQSPVWPWGLCFLSPSHLSLLYLRSLSCFVGHLGAAFRNPSEREQEPLPGPVIFVSATNGTQDKTRNTF